MPSRHDVSVRLAAPAPVVRAVAGQWATIEEDGAETCRLRMSADDLSWPVMLLGILNTPFTVESPPELTEAARAAARTLLNSTT